MGLILRALLVGGLAVNQLYVGSSPTGGAKYTAILHT